MGGGVLGGNLKGNIERHYGLFMHPQFGKGNSLVEKCRGETRNDLENPVKRIDCVKVPGEPDQGKSLVIMGLGGGRIEFNGLVECVNGIGEPVESNKRNALPVPGFRGFRVDPDRLFACMRGIPRYFPRSWSAADL